MKLWHVTQWGNVIDGVNGWDTQCIVSASTMEAAIEKGEIHISDYGSGKYRDGKADTIYLLGDDNRPDGEPKLVVRVWVAFADNLGHYPSWHKHEDKWIDSKTLYEPEIS